MGLLEQKVGGYGGGVKTCSCENAITKDLTLMAQPFDANWAKKATEVIETAVAATMPVKINALALDFQDGI